jgi:hypothetical protein
MWKQDLWPKRNGPNNYKIPKVGFINVRFNWNNYWLDFFISKSKFKLLRPLFQIIFFIKTSVLFFFWELARGLRKKIVINYNKRIESSEFLPPIRWFWCLFTSNSTTSCLNSDVNSKFGIVPYSFWNIR